MARFNLSIFSSVFKIIFSVPKFIFKKGFGLIKLVFGLFLGLLSLGRLGKELVNDGRSDLLGRGSGKVDSPKWNATNKLFNNTGEKRIVRKVKVPKGSSLDDLSQKLLRRV